MAYVSTCPYCGTNTLSAPWHPECRIAKLEDILNQIQKHLKKNQELPKELRKEILEEGFGTLKQFLKSKKDQEDRVWAQHVHDTIKAGEMDRISMEYDQKHPQPNAPRASKSKR